MKRLIASLIVVVAFTFYAIFARGGSNTQAVAVLPASDSGSGTSQTSSQTSQPAGSGYTDGTYTGSQADALYGVVQVQVVIEGGAITDVQFLSYPTGRHSDQINEQATPVLAQEAISSQSADVQVVSGATLTSRAFMQSLQSALDQA